MYMYTEMDEDDENKGTNEIEDCVLRSFYVARSVVVSVDFS